MFKRLSKDLAVYGFSEFIGYAIPFLTIPIYTRIFIPSEYGVLSLIASVIAMLAIFLNLGLDNATSRYFFEAKNQKERATIVSTGLWFLIAWSIFVIIAVSILSKHISVLSFKTPSYAVLYKLAFIAAPLGMVITYARNILRFYFAPWKFTIISISEAVLVFIFSLLFIVKFKLGLTGFFLGTIVGSLLTVVPSVWLIRYDLKPTFSFETVKKLLHYGVPFVPAGIAYWVFNLSDRFMISRLSTLEQLGLYSIAAKITLAVSFLSRIFGRAWSPHAFKLYASNDAHREIFGQMLTYLLAVFSYVAVSITLFGPEILRVFTTPQYYGAVYAICPLSLGLVAYGLNQITMLGINLVNKTHYISHCAWLAAIINIVLNFLLIPKYGMTGAAIATMVSYFILTVSYTLISQKLYPITLEINKMFKIIVIVTVFTAFSFFINSFSKDRIITSFFFLKITCLVLYPAILFLTGIFGKNEISFLKRTLQIVKMKILKAG